MKAKTFKIGNTIIIIKDNLPNEDDIRECYDVCNELFRESENCFYTKNETRDKRTLLFPNINMKKARE